MPTPRLLVVRLEDRTVPAVTIAPTADQVLFDGRPLYLPVTATNTPDGPVAVTVTSSDRAVTAEVLDAGRSVRFDVSGVDSNDQPFTGSITIRLFDDSAPASAQRVVDLVNSGFYTGKLFHRVLPGFVIQGGSPNGDGVGGSPLPDVDDEFDREYTFASPGIVAMANAGDDGNDSQFFITDPDVAPASRPESLNFNHSIIGLLTAGFDTYRRVITTRTTLVNGENSRPANPVTITGAAVFTDTADAVIKLSAAAGYRGRADITVRATDNSPSTPGSGAADSFVLTGAADGQNSRAFLNTPPTAVSVGGDPATVQFAGTDIDRDALTYAVRDLAFSGAPAGLTATIDAATGLATLTPPAGFFGTVQFRVGVRDQTDRTGRGLNNAGNFDTQLVTLTVAPRVTLTAPPTLVAGQSGAVTADVSGPADTAGTVEFRTADGSQLLATTPVVNGRAAASISFSAPGTYAVVARFAPADAATPVAVSASATVTVTGAAVDPPVSPPPVPPAPPAPPVPPPPPPVVPTPASTSTPVSVSSAPVGTGGFVTVAFADGTSRRIGAFDPGFLGGVTAILADVTGDGVAEVIAVPATGGGSILKVFDARTGNLVFEREAFEPTYRGGLTVSAGDFAGKGYSQIVIGAGVGGGPRVAVFDVPTGATVLDVFAGDPAGRTGVAVAATAETLYGTPRILTTVGSARGLFDGVTGEQVRAFTAEAPDPTSAAAPAGAAAPAAVGTTTVTATRTAAVATTGGVSMRQLLGSTPAADELAL